MLDPLGVGAQLALWRVRALDSQRGGRGVLAGSTSSVSQGIMMTSAEWWALPRCPDCCRRWMCVNRATGDLLRLPHRRRMLVGALMPGMIDAPGHQRCSGGWKGRGVGGAAD
jgi:hypothetical protein